MHRRQARAVAEVREDDPASRRFRPGHARQFLHEKRVGQPVKAVPPHALRLVAARDRQHPRHARQVMVKRRVEARHLRQVGKAVVKRLGQQDLLRQMLGIEWAEPTQLRDHLRVMRCGSLYFGPPCTTRCPTAANAVSPLRSSIQSISASTAAV